MLKFLAYFCCLGLATSPLFAQCVPFNSSVLMFDEIDVIGCPAQLEAEKTLGNRRINLLFTARFLIDESQKLTNYCFATEGKACDPLTDELLERMKGHWANCLHAATERNLDISVYVQIDDAGKSNLWRNNLKFDPLEKHNGYSYDDILIKPLAELAAKIVKPTNSIEFSLQGEMGATLAFQPRSYVDLIRLTKERLAPRKNIEVGVNVNFGAVLGFGTKLSEAMIPEVQALLYAIDFLGVSAYHDVMVPVQAVNFRDSFDQAAEELKILGVGLPANKALRISEIGMGGGSLSGDGVKPAKDVIEAAASLWSGVLGPYNKLSDPFQNKAIFAFRRDFYRELLAFLKSPPTDLNMRSAYLWNTDSWDVQGFYPKTTGYRDQVIVDAIRRQNANCN